MSEPGREAAAGIVLHRLHLGRRPKRVADALGGPLVIGGEAYPHMAVVEDRVVRPIGLLDLVQRLGDQEALDAVARHEGERRLEEVEPPQRREFVEHQEEPPPARLSLQLLGQTPADLVEDQADQRLGAVDVRRRHHEVERRRPLAAHDIADPPVAAPRHLGDHRIAIEAKERHGRAQDAGALVAGFVQQLPGGAGDDGMNARLAEMRRPHHGRERGLDWPLRIGQERRYAGERLVLLGIEDVKDGADQKRVAGFLPVVPLFEAAFGIDEDVGDVLNVAHLPLATPHFEQRIIGR